MSELTLGPKQFGIFRIMLGIHLTVHYLLLIPHTKELFSNVGALADPAVNLTYGFFPNPLYWFDGPLFVKAFVGLGVLLSALFTLGIKRRLVSFLLWFVAACLFHRNNFLENPAIYYVGWMLLAFSLTPAGEHYCLRAPPKRDWKFPPFLFGAAWFIMGLAYTVSGIDKYTNSESWRNGTAIMLIAQSGIANPSFILEIFQSLPDPVLRLVNWFALYSEIFSLPLILFGGERGKFIAWVTMLCTHIGIVFLLWIPDLTFGVILFHVFTARPNWWEWAQPRLVDSWKRVRSKMRLQAHLGQSAPSC